MYVCLYNAWLALGTGRGDTPEGDVALEASRRALLLYQTALLAAMEASGAGEQSDDGVPTAWRG